jgi:hypothetical protein
MIVPMDVLTVAPPSMAHLYVEIGQGHFVFYRDYVDAIQRMERRRQAAAARLGIQELSIGETLDMFWAD